jgi:predicted ArsR family transcriptional regulator
VSLPARRYDLAGDLLAAALVQAQRTGEPPAEVLAWQARERGTELGGSARDDDPELDARGAVLRLLEAQGFEPRVEDGDVVLVNCPFHSLAQQHTDLVCGMNLQLLEGVLAGAEATGWTAQLRPQPGACCVRLDGD